MALKVLGWAGLRRRVHDLNRSIAFYVEGLGFVDEGGGRLRLGEQVLELVADVTLPAIPDGRYAEGRIDTGFQHLAVVAADMEQAYRRLAARTPRAVSHGDPVVLPASSGGATAYKFVDPDGRPVELIQFPTGRGPSRWRGHGADPPTLGVDHSAIVVSDVERSVAYYRDQLGFVLTGRQLNRGPAQDRLDGLPDVAVEVIALSPERAETPHLELLGYVAPRPRAGRSTDTLTWWVADPVEDEVRDPDGHRHAFLCERSDPGPV